MGVPLALHVLVIAVLISRRNRVTSGHTAYEPLGLRLTSLKNMAVIREAVHLLIFKFNVTSVT